MSNVMVLGNQHPVSYKFKQKLSLQNTGRTHCTVQPLESASVQFCALRFEKAVKGLKGAQIITGGQEDVTCKKNLKQAE